MVLGFKVVIWKCVVLTGIGWVFSRSVACRAVEDSVFRVGEYLVLREQEWFRPTDHPWRMLMDGVWRELSRITDKDALPCLGFCKPMAVGVPLLAVTSVSSPWDRQWSDRGTITAELLAHVRTRNSAAFDFPQSPLISSLNSFEGIFFFFFFFFVKRSSLWTFLCTFFFFFTNNNKNSFYVKIGKSLWFRIGLGEALK